MTVDTEHEAPPFLRRKWLAFLGCGAAAELPLLPPPTTSTATSSASDIPRAFVEQYGRHDTNNEIAGAFRALNPRPSSANEAKDAHPHDTKGPRRPASARMRQPGAADAVVQSTRGARPPSPAGGTRRLILPPRLGPGRGPPPCCPQCGLARFPRVSPPPPLLRGGMGGRSYPPRPFMGPRRHFPGRGMPPRPGMWWVGRGPPPPRPGVGRGPRGTMRGGYGRGRGRGGRCLCNTMGPMRGVAGRPLPRPGGMVGFPPGRGGRDRRVGAGPGRSCDQSSAAPLSCTRPEARPEDEEEFAQPARPISRSNFATRKEAGLSMKISSHKDGNTLKATPADSAVTPSAKPPNIKNEMITVSEDCDPAYIGQGGPMLAGGMSKRRPKSAPPVIAGSSRPEDSEAESTPLPDQGDFHSRLQPAVAPTVQPPEGVAEDQCDNETTRTVADGPTGGLDFPQGVARPPISAATRASPSCRPAAATTSGHAASSGAVDAGSLTAARSEASPAADNPGTRELTAPSEGATADRPASPLSVEDVLAAALEGNCIVWAGGGGGAAAPGGGWLVAAAIPPGRLSARRRDGNNSNVDAVAEVEHEGKSPETATSCTQWEKSDVLVEDAPKVPLRTIPPLWATKPTPAVLVSNPFFVGVEDKPSTLPDASAATAGERCRANGSGATKYADASTAAAPAISSSSSYSGSGNSSRGHVCGLTAETSGEGSPRSKPTPGSTSSKGCSKPSTTAAAPTESPTPSTPEPPKSDDIDQDVGGGGRNHNEVREDGGDRVKDTMLDRGGAMSAAASGIETRPIGTSNFGVQTDEIESDQHASLGGVEGGHPLINSSSRPSDLDGRVTARAPSSPRAVIAADVDEQKGGESTPQAEDEEAESSSFPGSLGGAPAASQVCLHQEEEIVADHLEAATDPAANMLRDGGGRGGFDALTAPAACAKEVPTTTTQTSPPSRAASSMGHNNSGGGGGVEGGGLDAFPDTTKNPSSNTTNHNTKAGPASEPMPAAAPVAAPCAGTTPPSGQPGVSARGGGSVPHGMERSPETGGSLTQSSGSGGWPIVTDSSGIIGDREEVEEHDGHAGEDDEAGDGPVAVEMRETQTESDIDAAVRKADAPQLFFLARPWATQLEHEFVPDDSAGESFGTIIIAGSRRKRLSDTTAMLENGLELES